MRSGDESVKVQGRYALSVEDGNAYLAAGLTGLTGLTGLGILWLPGYMARPHVAKVSWCLCFGDWKLDTMPLYIAFLPNRHVSAKLRVFIERVAGVMAEHALVTRSHASQ